MKTKAPTLEKTIASDKHHVMSTVSVVSSHSAFLALPVEEDSLWPPGELAQIIGTRPLGFGGGSVDGASSFVITFTRDGLLVRGARRIALSEDDIAAYCTNGIEFYRPGYSHLVQDLVGEFGCAADSITRVVLGRFGAGTRLTVWVHDGNQRDKEAIDVVVCQFMPATIMRLANQAADEGIIERSRFGGLNRHAWPLYRRLLERRFRQAAPGATIIIKGRVLDDKVFMRLVR